MNLVTVSDRCRQFVRECHSLVNKERYMLCQPFVFTKQLPAKGRELSDQVLEALTRGLAAHFYHYLSVGERTPRMPMEMHPYTHTPRFTSFAWSPRSGNDYDNGAVQS
jgi:hypothetical protein